MTAQQNNPGLSDVDKLRRDAARAADVRELTTHPDVVALRVEKVRAQVDALMWAGIVLGLAFTMVNVQTFAAAGAAVWSLPWLAAWLLDPMVSVVLVAVLRAEQVTARWQVDTGVWVRRTKVYAFAATYVMNTWVSWSHLHWAGIVLHSVPPLLVYCAAETGPVLRDRLTEAVLCAARTTPTTGAGQTVAAVADTAPAVEPTSPVTEPAARPRAATTTRRPATRTARPPVRKGLADYVTEARAAWTPGTEVTPSWVRSVTDARKTMSKNVADALKADQATNPHTTTTAVSTPVDLPSLTRTTTEEVAA